MTKPRLTSGDRRRVYLRAKGCCEYCMSQAEFSMGPFTVEHIIPTSRKGENVLDNLALACHGCNGHKYTKTEGIDPISEQIVPLFHPRNQVWNEHFRWDNDFTLIIGITATGRATVDALQLNRSYLANYRRALYRSGDHPPLHTR